MVQREQKIKSENGQTKPKQEEHFELLIHSPPAADHAPNQRGKKQRRTKGKLRTFFSGEPEGEHRRHPKEDRQCIGCENERADIENRRHVERDHCPKTNVFAKQTLPKIKKQQTRARRENRTPETHAEF